MSFKSMLLNIGVKPEDNLETKAQKNIFTFLMLLGTLASFFIPLIFITYIWSQNALGDIADVFTVLLIVWLIQWISSLLIFIDFSRKKEIGLGFYFLMIILFFYLFVQTYLYGGLFIIMVSAKFLISRLALDTATAISANLNMPTSFMLSPKTINLVSCNFFISLRELIAWSLVAVLLLLSL